ncbi:MAG: hypothetical protein IJW04_04175 [Ruminococcus sp.]|nr:hypothetical protein [Ruminococcus sp.]
MSRKIKSVLATALLLLMAFAALGTVAVSAAGNYYDADKDPNFAVYFEDCKNWNQVWAYVWTETDIKDSEGNVIDTIVTEVAPFPGIQLEKAGTTTLIDKVEHPDATQFDIYEFRPGEYKKGMEDGKYHRAFVIFNQGFEHGQQSSAVHIGKFFCGIHLVDLDKDNTTMVGHAISPEYIHLFNEKKKG